MILFLLFNFFITENFKHVHYAASTIINILPSLFLLDLYPLPTPYLIILFNIVSVKMYIH